MTGTHFFLVAILSTLDTLTDSIVNDWDFEYKYWPVVAIAGTLDTFIDL